MKILNYGSLNIDHVYNVDHFVKPGETMACTEYSIFAGGKGNNQSIALAKAGAEIFHAGKIGKDGLWLKDNLTKTGANTDFIFESDKDATGHAIIQVNTEGENCIIIHSGTNGLIKSDEVDKVLSGFSSGDYLLLQNEINKTAEIIEKASAKGMKVVLNPAPMTDEIKEFPINLLDTIIINEIEGEDLTGVSAPEDIISKINSQYPNLTVILTLGSKGVMSFKNGERITVDAEKVKAIDTTAAGDTFIGYYLAETAKGTALETALKTACKASAICVTRKGATDSIPSYDELV
ncbi:MAG: ribokinase [Planctomycetota bacterium]|jgi:ribokinase